MNLPEGRLSRESALAFIRAGQGAYARLSRGIEVSRGQNARGFCERVLGHLRDAGVMADRGAPWWVAADSQAPPLAHVLAALLAVQSKDWASAARHARTAVALDGADLFAQQLLLAAESRNSELRSELDDWLADRFCPRPFEALETRVNGDVNSCCRAWMPATLGNIHRESAEEIWNSPAAQEIRRSILEGDFRYCSRVYCPKITTRSLPKRSEVKHPEYREIIRRRQTKIGRGPRRVLLSHDRSCNLSCPSCRTALIVAKKDEQARLNRLLDRVLLPLLKDARSVKITGSGDPFGSRHFRDLLQRLDPKAFPQLKLEIQTNGQLMDETAWRELGLEGRVERVLVSIDSARSGTYARVRRGGTLRRLLRNLLFLRSLRQEGRIGFLQLDYVVQWLNYREIPEAVDLARRLKADRIYFQLIRNWGTYTAREFEQHNIADPSHAEYGQFMAVLRDERMQADHVDLGNMKPLVDEALKGPRRPYSIASGHLQA